MHPIAAEFFESARLLSDQHQSTLIAYVAVKRDEAFQLVAGRIVFNIVGQAPPTFSFASEKVCAALFLASSDATPSAIVGQLLKGEFPTTEGRVVFSPNDNNSFAMTHFAYGPPPQSQVRLQTLRVYGHNYADWLDYEGLGWHLRSCSTPYDGLFELFEATGIPQPQDYRSIVDVVALPLAHVDSNRSTVDGETAKIFANVGVGIDLSRFHLGLKIRGPSIDPILRRQISASELEWKSDDRLQRGTITVPVSRGSIVECIACLDGDTQHFYWITDPNVGPNVGRNLIGAFDTNLERFAESLSWQGVKGRDARDFEIGLCWLLWMLGFSPVQIDAGGKGQGVVDIVVGAPDNTFLLVECTTGLLKAEGKLANLVARSERVRRVLRDSGQNSTVLSVIVTPQPLEELVAEISAAAEHGISVISRERLNDLTERTKLPPDAVQSLQIIQSFVPPKANSLPQQ